MSIIIHSVGCNLKCFECFNYQTVVLNKTDCKNEGWVIEQIKKNGFLSDTIIFSGGEFLNNKIDDIISFMNKVRSCFDGIVIIYTNGTHPVKMKILCDLNLCDGFHTDMKLPYYSLSNLDSELFETTVGIKHDDETIKKMIEAIDITVHTDKGFSQVRSVRYPYLSNQIFESNKKYIDGLNDKYNKNTPYFVNEFIEIEGDKQSTHA